MKLRPRGASGRSASPSVMRRAPEENVDYNEGIVKEGDGDGK